MMFLKAANVDIAFRKCPITGRMEVKSFDINLGFMALLPKGLIKASVMVFNSDYKFLFYISAIISSR